MQPLRAYFFTNFYLSSIQHGVQTAHAVASMFNYYREGRDAHKMFQWAENDKTIIILNGGNCDDLKSLRTELSKLAPKMALPYGYFHEDDASLNGALTCVGIIIPEEIYIYAESVREDPQISTLCCLLPDEKELAEILNRYSLAR